MFRLRFLAVSLLTVLISLIPVACDSPASGRPEDEFDKPALDGNISTAVWNGNGPTLNPSPTSFGRFPSGGQASGFGGIPAMSLSPPSTTLEMRSWKRTAIAPNSTRLMVGDKEELPLKSLQVQVKIEGFRARVVIDGTWLNDRKQQLEGTFQLSLPDRASPYFLAFGESLSKARGGSKKIPQNQTFSLSSEEIMEARQSIWERPKVARMVPRVEGARAYRNTVHRRVDPALLEWSGAGIFNSRVFPLMPGKLHRIVFAYDVDLQRVGENLQWSLDLPKDLPESSVEVVVLGSADQTLQLSPLTPITKEASSQRACWRGLKGQTLTLAIKAPGPSLLVGRDAALGDHFALSCQAPDLGEETVPGAAKAVFLVDVSLSANPDRFNIQLALLEAILQSNRPEIAEFAVLFFNIETFWYKSGFLKNSPEEVQDLRRFAEGLALEGASDLELALRTAARPSGSEALSGAADVFLLSDAAVTWGELDPKVIQATAAGLGRVFSYRTGLIGENDRLLEGIARASGGAVFSLVAEAEVAAAARAHRTRPWMISSYSLEGGSDILIRGRPRALYDGQALVVCGRGRPKDGAKLSFDLQRGEQRKRLEIELPKALQSELAPRVYGEVATGCLEELKAEEARSYAIHYRVPGQSCSLLMLENEYEYQAFEIEPEVEAYLVLGSPAGERCQAILTVPGDSLAAAPSKLLALLERRQKNGWGLGSSGLLLKRFVERTEPELLTLRTQSLQCQSREKTRLSSSFAAALLEELIDHERVNEEAEHRMTSLSADDALKALSNLTESRPGDLDLSRDVALAALAWGRPQQAYHLLLRLVEAGYHEALLYRLLAHCCEDSERPELAMYWYEMTGQSWGYAGFGDRWMDSPEALSFDIHCDYLSLLRRALAGKIKVADLDLVRIRIAELEEGMESSQKGLRVNLCWSSDATDVDLYVLEPGGENCFYGKQRTALGGMSWDIRRGYGPESYQSRNPTPGRYRVSANYFQSNQVRVSARTRCLLTITKNPGQLNQERRQKAVLLTAKGDSQEIDDFVWE